MLVVAMDFLEQYSKLLELAQNEVGLAVGGYHAQVLKH